jgi:hypothetical protein
MNVKITIDGKPQPWDFNLRAQKVYKDMTGKSVMDADKDLPEMIYAGYFAGCKIAKVEPLTFDDFLDAVKIESVEGNP